MPAIRSKVCGNRSSVGSSGEPSWSSSCDACTWKALVPGSGHSMIAPSPVNHWCQASRPSPSTSTSPTAMSWTSGVWPRIEARLRAAQVLAVQRVLARTNWQKSPTGERPAMSTPRPSPTPTRHSLNCGLEPAALPMMAHRLDQKPPRPALMLALVRGLCGVRPGAAPAIARGRGGVRLAGAGSGVACVTIGWQGGAPGADRCPRELPRVTTTSTEKKILLDSYCYLDN